MKTLHFETRIAATPERVWHCLTDPECYRIWTFPFCAGSYYETPAFAQGNRIHLLTPEGHGMYSLLQVVDPPRKLVFQHLGNILGFKEVPQSAEPHPWENALETYELIPEPDGVRVKVEVDTVETHIGFMEKTFPVALAEWKRIAENPE
jgi:uncharacterized protein YndB with AHSA1/START domain